MNVMNARSLAQDWAPKLGNNSKFLLLKIPPSFFRRARAKRATDLRLASCKGKRLCMLARSLVCRLSLASEQSNEPTSDHTISRRQRSFRLVKLARQFFFPLSTFDFPARAANSPLPTLSAAKLGPNERGHVRSEAPIRPGAPFVSLLSPLIIGRRQLDWELDLRARANILSAFGWQKVGLKLGASQLISFDQLRSASIGRTQTAALLRDRSSRRKPLD